MGNEVLGGGSGRQMGPLPYRKIEYENEYDYEYEEE
jgi:hypothetical protein